MTKITLDSQPLFGAAAEGAVECLGLTFPSEDARRVHFSAILKAKLTDPEFRKIAGFPKGSDEDILRLSDPPYFTLCPNPFMDDFIRSYGKPYDPAIPYARKPLAINVSEGKTDPIYTADSYHTKVPHKAIMRAILHYTDPGDILLDGFAGSGMTGIAAQLCGSPNPDYKKLVTKNGICWRGTAEVGCPARTPRRPVAGRYVYRCELQYSLRLGSLPGRSTAHPG